MSFQQDWLMRQIESLVQVVARIVFQRDFIRYEVRDPAVLTRADNLYLRLTALLRNNRICEAEDLLFAQYDPSLLEVAVDFYRRLNALSDETLTAGNFSREEISEGLRGLLGLSGLSSEALS